MSRYFLSNEAEAGVKLERLTEGHFDKWFAVMKTVYPDLREVNREEYDAAEFRAALEGVTEQDIHETLPPRHGGQIGGKDG